MKENTMPTCPGCKKHRAMGAAQCKYGQRYFSELERSIPSAERETDRGDRKDRTHKWEKNLERGGLVWNLVRTGRKARKALKRREISEKQLLDVLNEAERTELAEILEKLSRQVQAEKQSTGM